MGRHKKNHNNNETYSSVNEADSIPRIPLEPQTVTNTETLTEIKAVENDGLVTSGLAQVIPGSFVPNTDAPWRRDVQEGSSGVLVVGQGVAAFTETAGEEAVSTEPSDEGVAAFTPMAGDDVPTETVVERPTEVQLHSNLYTYDIRKRHAHDMQKTLNLFRTRTMAAEVTDDIGQKMTGETMPLSVHLEGIHILGVIKLKLEPWHKVEKMLGIKNVEGAEAPKAKAKTEESLSTDKP